MATQLNDWLSIDKVSGTGNAQITLTASSYQELVERTQSLVIQGQKESVYLNVKQNGIVPSATLDSYEIDAYTEGIYTNGITSNVPWTAIVNGDWFTIDKTSGNEGYTNFNVTTSKTETDREGNISFYHNSVLLCTLTITNIVPSTNIITYKTTDGNIFVPYITYRKDNLVENWGSLNVISNTYENGIGTIICSHPIKTIDWYDNNVNRSRKLSEINLPEGLEEIGDSAFSYTSIQSIIFPTTLKTIKNFAFKGSYLKTINFPSTLTYVGEGCFSFCDKLTEVFIPYTLSKGFHNVVSIWINGEENGKYMFQSCGNLRNITFEEGATYIPMGICSGCSNLTTVNFPSTLLSIGELSFASTKLSELDLPNNLIMIHRRAFSSSNATYQNLTIPNSVRYIMDGAFEGNTQLKRLVMNPEIVDEEAFFNCGIVYCDWGNRLQKVGHYAFNFNNGDVNCEYAKPIPPTITFIDDEPFHYNFKVTPEDIANLTNLEYIGVMALTIIVTNSPIINMPNSLVFCGDISIETNSNFDENIIVNFGNNLRYCNLYNSDNFYVRFSTETPPYLTNIRHNHILNDDGEYAFIKGIATNGFAFNVEYSTTDGKLWDNPSNSEYITNHVYGMVSYFVPPQDISFSNSFGIGDTENLKTITFPENFDYVYGEVSVSNASNLELIKAPSSSFDNGNYDRVVNVELYDKTLSAGGNNYVKVINPDNLLTVNNVRLPYQPLNAYVINGYEITEGWKNYKSTYGKFTTIDFNLTDGTIVLNDKMISLLGFGLSNPEDNPNVTFIYKDADIEEFYTI